MFCRNINIYWNRKNLNFSSKLSFWHVSLKLANLHKKCKKRKTKKITLLKIHFFRGWFSSICKICLHSAYLLFGTGKMFFSKNGNLLNKFISLVINHTFFYRFSWNFIATPPCSVFDTQWVIWLPKKNLETKKEEKVWLVWI